MAFAMLPLFPLLYPYELWMETPTLFQMAESVISRNYSYIQISTRVTPLSTKNTVF